MGGELFSWIFTGGSIWYCRSSSVEQFLYCLSPQQFRPRFVSVLISILIYVLPIVLIFRFGLLSFDQFLSIMPSGDFNVAMLLSMQGVSVTGNEIPMWSINLLLTAAGVLAVLLGGRKIFWRTSGKVVLKN